MCVRLFVLIVLTSLALVSMTMSAFAQDVKTDAPQQPAATTQDVNPDQGQAPAAEPEKAQKTPYFGPAKLAWDTTVKYNSMFRLLPRSAKISDPLVNPSNYNQDDGDNNFHGGLVSDRTDFLSEMDISFGSNFGFRGSAAAWWNPIYNQRTGSRASNGYSYNSNFPASTTWYTNPGFVGIMPDYTHFSAQTKETEFLQAELLDAFVHVRVPMGNSTLTLRGGQFAQQWGQTVFFGGNGIAGAMAPMDLIKLLSVPNAQFKEIVRPVPQVSMNLQINPKVSIGAYYQLHFVPTRFPSVGTYFSSGDVLGAGASRFFLAQAPAAGPEPWLIRAHDILARNSGEFGVQVAVRASGGWDLGFYGLQFHDSAPQFYLSPCFPGTPVQLCSASDNHSLSYLEFGSFKTVYPENIKAFGMSASKTVGITNWAAEVSGRLNQDLAVAATLVPYTGVDNNKNSAYPSGSTLHANVSMLTQFHPNFIAKDSSIMAEVAWNNLLSVTKNASTWASEGNATKNAIAFMAVYTPTYHQVRSGLDVSIPIGLNFSPYGRSALGPAFATEKGGFFNVGVSLAYRNATFVTVTYQNFIGEQGGSVNSNSQFGYKQVYGDRDYLVFSIHRTFGLRASQKAH